jgi:predicted SnoaL-like aldol condensation-catalyzing enzyme
MEVNMKFHGFMRGVRALTAIGVVVLMLGLSVSANAQSQAEKNKKIAVAFLTMIFNEHKVAEAFDLYSVPTYKQHNPLAKSGAKAAIDFLGPYLKGCAQCKTEIKRVIADGDLVAIHNNPTSGPNDRGRAVVDIFRIENGKVVEHWDVVQDVPAQSANENTMF